ncbi:MarR family transcriptional regulator [Sphingomonas trueperi]|uniref:MarR family transcriptional regulator n=1 Tax=Sphingomonas trueperi TaxID=53317 RepID=UPI0033913A29
MLIDLFLARERGRSISVSSLCIASNVPQTTALRWIGTLEAEGLIYRTNDPEDRRRAYLALTMTGADQVADCIARWRD